MLTQREKSRITNFFAITLILQIVNSREKILSLWRAFLHLGLNHSCCTATLWFWGRRVGTGLIETHLRPARAQVKALVETLGVSYAHDKKCYHKKCYSKQNMIQQD